jgi:hypothetical protein
VGAGFVYLLAVLAAAVGLLWWGLSTPEREELWWDLTAVQAGLGYELPPERVDKLIRTLLETPALARQLAADRRGAFLTAREGRYLVPGKAPLLLFDGGEPTVPVVAWFAVPGADSTDTSLVTIHTGTRELTVRLEGTDSGSVVLPPLETGVPVVWTVQISSVDGDEEEAPQRVRAWLQPQEDRDE